MTEKVQHIIDDIRLKIKGLKDQLNVERNKNITIQNELKSLTEQIQSEIEKKEEILSENVRLKLELETAKSQVVEVSRPLGKKDEEIDELVKEIEHCISQLKK